MSIWFKRTKSEIRNLVKKSDLSKFLTNSDTNCKEFNGFVAGPDGSFYEGYLFEIVVRLDEKYPMSPPIVYFKTKIFHPNIHLDKGEVCLDILSNNWKPVFDLTILLQSIQDLLLSPNPDSPLNCDAGNF